MNLEQCSIPTDRHYTIEHVWVLEQGKELVLGISDFAQDQLGEIQFIDLPDLGGSFGAGDGFGTVESIKSVSTLHMPITGRVTAVNSELEDSPALINVDCYSKGWIIRIEAGNPTEKDLLDADAYRAFLAKENTKSNT